MLVFGRVYRLNRKGGAKDSLCKGKVMLVSVWTYKISIWTAYYKSDRAIKSIAKHGCAFLLVSLKSETDRVFR